jgi:hypothetical protein
MNKRMQQHDHDHVAITRAFILNPERWPRWPLLPVKKYNHPGITTGIIAAVKGEELRVYVDANLFDFDIVAARKAGNHVTYKSVDEMLAAGWLVD